MQDAGIYTYINVDGVRYTVEFNIRTIPEDGTTQLEFFVWADTIVSVQRAFQSVIDRENMQIKATGFSVLYDKDYQNLTNEQMLAELEPVIKALFASLAEKATVTDVVEKTEAQYCSQCGKPLVPGHAFCGKCGTPVKK
jgi:NADH pyrophosphatase NudC (nudix superfamily)